ncbi:MAG: PP2C family protein-serine/threonine phosphatase [Roseiflexaceae bacterium]
MPRQSLNETLIGQVPLFVTLPPDELRRLAETLRPCEIPARTILFREGEYGERFYIVLDGQIEIVKALGTADERLIGVRGPGEYVGEMSLLHGDGLRTATVRARVSTQLLEMTRAEFDALLHRQPTLAYEMVRVLSVRLRESDDATIRDLQEKNRQLTQAYQELQSAQTQLIEKERLERELQVARSIQESILPRNLPQLAGFDFDARIVPARTVGGDCFDFIPLGPDTLGIVVGDACDKGVPAAIFMALTRSLVRAEASRARSPREALLNVNRHLLDMNDVGMFVTALYGVLNRSRRTFDYARAGHALPLVRGVGGAVLVPSHSTGQPLGLWPDMLLDEQRVVIPRGGALLLYTDGVTEAIDPQGTLFGVKRLRAAMSAHPSGSARELCDQVLQAVTAFSGTAPQEDDVTLVAVHAQ